MAEKTHILWNRVGELLPDRDAWDEVNSYVEDIWYDHTTLKDIGVDSKNPDSKPEYLRAIADEAVKRYRMAHGLE